MCFPVAGFVSDSLFFFCIVFANCARCTSERIGILLLQLVQNLAFAVMPYTTPDWLYIIVTGVVTAVGGGLYAYLQVAFASVVSKMFRNSTYMHNAITPEDSLVGVGLGLALGLGLGVRLGFRW